MFRIRIENRRRRDDGTYTDWEFYDFADDVEKVGRLIGKFPEFYRALDPQTREVLPITEISGYCNRQAHAGELIMDPCPACGHTLLLHPSISNPALTECVICKLLEIRH